MIRNSPAKQPSPAVNTPGGVRAVPTTSASSSPNKLMVPENLTLKQREQIQMALSNYTTPELVVVKMGNGRLKITAKDSIVVDDPIDANKRLSKAEVCIKCKRHIDGEELYFHLPIDPDRRRTWGKILGLSYERMVSSNTSCDTICTDHFTEACLAKYGYNKTSVETHGEPYNTDMPNEEMSSYGSHMNCCIKWKCTLCTFHSRSVIILREHVLKEHLTGAGERQLIRDLQDNKVNLLCPFCRQTGYGYKTVSGFLKHIQTQPGEHLYLKRIAIKAEAKCRMQFLEPNDKWESWTEDNIVLGMYGALMHRIKRKVPKSEVELTNLRESKSSTPEDHQAVLSLLKLKEGHDVPKIENPHPQTSQVEENKPKSVSPPVLQPAPAPPKTTALILKKPAAPTPTKPQQQPESGFILPAETKSGEVIKPAPKPALPSLESKVFSPPTRTKLGYVDFTQKLKSLPSSPAAKRLYREGTASHGSSPEYSLKKSAEARAVRMRLFGGETEPHTVPMNSRIRLTPKEPKIESARLVESPRKDPGPPSMPLETFINEAVNVANNSPNKTRKSRDEMKVIRAQQQPAFPVGNPVFISVEDVQSNFARVKPAIKRTYSSSALADPGSSSPVVKGDEGGFSSSQPVLSTADFKHFADRRIVSKKARQNLFGYISSDDEDRPKQQQMPAKRPAGTVRHIIVRKAAHGKPIPLSASPSLQRRIVSLRSKSGLPIPVVDAIHKADDEVSRLRYSPMDNMASHEPPPPPQACTPPPSITKKVRILRNNK